MRVLLNATNAELTALGGDVTYYRDLRSLSHRSAIEFLTLDSSVLRSASSTARRIINRFYRSGMPRAIRMWLFINSRRTLLSQRNPLGPAPDLLLSHILLPGYLGRFVKHLPVVWSTQGISPADYYAYRGTGGYLRDDVIDMYGALGRRCAALIIWTESCADPFREAFPELAERVRVIHPPVLPPARVSVKPSSLDGVLRLLFVGLDPRRKGLIEVLGALAMLPREFSVQLTVVTRSANFPEITRVHDLRMRLLNSDPSLNVQKLMDESDLFVLPTHADTYGLAAVEAMSRGCATIVSDLSPLPEVAPDGKVGFVVARGNPETIAQKVLTLATNVPLLRRYQESAYDLFLKRNHPDVVISLMHQLFEEVIEEHRGQRPY